MRNLHFVSIVLFLASCGEQAILVEEEIAPHQLKENNVEYSKRELEKLRAAKGEVLSMFQKDKLFEYLEGGRTVVFNINKTCLLYTSPSPRDATLSRMPSSA